MRVVIVVPGRVVSPPRTLARATDEKELLRRKVGVSAFSFLSFLMVRAVVAVEVEIGVGLVQL